MSETENLSVQIERLRQEFPDTQELYREVCTLLFFRHGITPTANKLYQLVRKGSMSAPAEALAKFWEDLRTKSRVRIEHPDLPDELKTAAGELVATLWSQAQKTAAENYRAQSVDAQRAVQEAQAAQAIAEAAQVEALQRLKTTQQTVASAEARLLELERHLAAERAVTQGLSGQLAAVKLQHEGAEAALVEARRDFGAALEKTRQALQRSEERCEASEKRALLEIDRERTHTVALQKELMQLRQERTNEGEQHRASLQRLQEELTGTRERLGASEGALQELRAANQLQAEHIRKLQTGLAHRNTELALLQRDHELACEKTAALEQALEQLRLKSSEPKVNRVRKKRTE